jgi:hypothetical protein
MFRWCSIAGGETMKLIYTLLGLLLWANAFSASAEESASAQCPAVNCDCAVIDEPKLRELCLVREAQVVSDCVANQGKPKTFCGLHGPNAFPLAISLHTTPVVGGTQDLETVRQLVTTQSWSLEESYKALNNREKALQFGDAIQVLSLLERDSERLHGLHKQVLAGLQSAQRANEAVESGAAYAVNTLVWAKQLRAYGDQLWQIAQAAEGERNVKAYRALALKSTRLAAEVYEFGADLYVQVGKNQESALAWQAAAEIAQSLVAWERAGDNNPQHVEFYKAQAAARWYRATYLWLGTDNKEAVVSALERALAVGKDADALLVKSEHDLHDEEQDSRAIKRGSR